MARKMSKAAKWRLAIWGTISVGIILYLLFSILYNTYRMYTLTKQKNKLENQYVELQEEAEELKTMKEKLNDEDYLANYARETYLYSKDGEYIIQLDEDIKDNEDDMDSIEELIDEVSNNINKNYIIIGLSVLMLFIFVHIVRKGKRRKKKKKKL